MDVLTNLDPISIALGVGIGAILVLFLSPSSKSKGQVVNLEIQKDQAKVATMCPLKDIEDTVTASDKGVAVYCRCWRSKTFPLCDGAHVAHNKATGDNVGPLVIKK
mmetsp:Transcript_19951/g.29993  ORF Transcript_19951/g.29993 Transcript_19951/m.29993 type:complete len:106 (-) Transcript_19951:252-569(-)